MQAQLGDPVALAACDDELPTVDDDLVVDGWQLVVTRREGNRVAELRLHRPPGVPVP